VNIYLKLKYNIYVLGEAALLIVISLELPV